MPIRRYTLKARGQIYKHPEVIDLSHRKDIVLYCGKPHDDVFNVNSSTALSNPPIDRIVHRKMIKVFDDKIKYYQVLKKAKLLTL